ncbi:MAG: hypothetical protein KDC39_11895 [Actinobacteria bacterium]|nr:hypothetical protein [Actinomycetota bacterium]
MSQRRLHLANPQGRDAVVAGEAPPTPPSPKMGVNGQPAQFHRFVAGGAGCRHEDLTSQYGDDYASALIEADPEVDFEVVGRSIDATQAVLLSGSGEPLFAAPELVDITYDPDGNETRRAPASQTPATINTETPLRWTGRRIPTGEAVRRFVFQRSLQLTHVDGVTFDFLYSMAKELAEAGEMVLLGAGASGKEPLIMQVNGSPYRGFLEGRINDEQYLLLLHLSNMELKVPAAWQQDPS